MAYIAVDTQQECVSCDLISEYREK